MPKNDTKLHPEVRNLTPENLTLLNEKGHFGPHKRNLESMERARERDTRKWNALSAQLEDLKKRKLPEGSAGEEEEEKRIEDEVFEIQTRQQKLGWEMLRLRLDAWSVLRPEDSYWDDAVWSALGKAWTTLKKLKATIRKGGNIPRDIEETEFRLKARMVVVEELIRIQSARIFLQSLLEKLYNEDIGTMEPDSVWDLSQMFLDYMEAMTVWYGVRMKAFADKLRGRMSGKVHERHTEACKAAGTRMNDLRDRLNRMALRIGIKDLY